MATQAADQLAADCTTQVDDDAGRALLEEGNVTATATLPNLAAEATRKDMSQTRKERKQLARDIKVIMRLFFALRQKKSASLRLKPRMLVCLRYSVPPA
jgi:hypothetical protein